MAGNSSFLSISEMSYSGYYRQPAPTKIGMRLWDAAKKEEIKIRKENYNNIWRETEKLGLCADLEQDGITPYVVPLNIPKKNIPNVIKELNNIGINALERKFDINRCVFDSNYKSRVIIPIHSGITENVMDRLITTLKK